MPLQTINVGTTANDETGDSLRDGFIVANTNLSEIYNFIGDGTNLSITGSFDISNITISEITTNSGNIILDSATQAVEIKGDNSSTANIVLNSENNLYKQTIVAQPHSAAVTNVLTLPAGGNQEIVGNQASQNLSNKTILDAILTGDSVTVPSGNTAARPVTPSTGMLRVNTGDNLLEIYDGSSWVQYANALNTSNNIVSLSGETPTLDFDINNGNYLLTLNNSTTTLSITNSENISDIKNLVIFNNFLSNEVSSGVTYTGDSFSANYGYGLAFKDDGTKMYVLSYGNDRIDQYNLSTAWDVTTAGSLVSFSVLNEDGQPFDLQFSSDGYKVFVLGSQNDNIYEYNMTTAWDVSTASYSNNYYNHGAQNTSVLSMSFSPDGHKLFTLGSGSSSSMQVYSLSTAWDITTVSYDGSRVLSFSTNSSSYSYIRYGLNFLPDGSSFYLVSYTYYSGSGSYSSFAIRQVDLSSNWDVLNSTLTYSSATLVSRPYALSINTNNPGVFHVINNSGNVLKYYFASASLILPNNLHYSANFQSPNYGGRQGYKLMTFDNGTKYYLLSHFD